MAALEQSKKDTLKKKTGFSDAELGKRAALQLVHLREQKPDEKFEIEDTPTYQAWKKEVNEHFTEEIDELKFAASSAYDLAIQENQTGYDILMGIAEDIGYDATGKSTKVNDLNEVSLHLAEFIAGGTLSKVANEERVFIANLKEITGSLFDPKTYRPSSRALLARIATSNFPIHSLRSLITHRSAGDWGEDVDYQDEEESYTKCLVIRGTEFDNELNLRIASGREKYRQIRTSKLSRMNIEANDLLIEKSGGSPDQPVGRVALLTADLLNSQSVCYSNFVEKIKPDQSKVIPAYLFHYLKFVHAAGVTDLLQSQTNGIRNLMIHRYLNLPISVPPKEIQQKLVDAIDDLQRQTISLREQANMKLEQARACIASTVLKA